MSPKRQGLPWLNWLGALLIFGLFCVCNAQAVTLPSTYVNNNYNQQFSAPTNQPNCVNGTTTSGAPPGLSLFELGCTVFVAGTPTMAGTFTITATPNGSGMTTTATLVVLKRSPSITLSASPTSTSSGSSVVFTFTASGGYQPAGEVKLLDGLGNMYAVGMLTPSGETTGSGTISTAALPTGLHNIKVSYDGDGNNESVSSNSIAINVAQATPAIGLGVSPASPGYGSVVTLTATMSGGNVPGGTVTFKDGSTTLGSGTISGGTASFSTSGLAVGSHSITATYGGDVNNAAVTSSATAVTVAPATPTLTLSAAPASISHGAVATFTATLAGGSVPGGTVTFKDGATTLGSGTISGSTASFSTSSLAVGSHSITAIYGGDANNATATSPAATVTVASATPVISLGAAPASISYGATTTLTATISGGSAPSGTVVFKDGATALGSGTISGGMASFSTAALGTGTHSITATYGGDAHNAAVTSNPVSVSVSTLTPGLSVSASATSLSYGAAATFTVTLSGGATPTGTITLKDGAATLGSRTLSGASVSFTTSLLSVGSHAITAVYSGDANNASITSSALQVNVTTVATTLSLSASATSLGAGAAVTLTARLTGGAAPGGTVTFKEGAAVLGSGTIANGMAAYTTSLLGVGSHAIQAIYSGDANNAGATSGSITLMINAVTPSIAAISPSSGPAAGGTSVTITGANLGNATAVTFGGSAAAITANSATSITVLSPAHVAGSVDVTVTTADGRSSSSNAFTYTARPDPSRNATVVANLNAQTQSVRQFSMAQIGNFTQRLTALHDNGWASPSFGLAIRHHVANNETDSAWARRGDSVTYDSAFAAASPLADLRKGLRQTSTAAAATDRRQADSGDEHALPDLPGAVAMQQPLSLWIAGSLEFGEQKISAQGNGARFRTNGISFGGDYRLSDMLSLGLGAGYSRSATDTDNAGSRSNGQGVVAVAYGSLRPIQHWYIDGLFGYGILNFHNQRYLSETGEYASGSRNGHQVFAALVSGYEFTGQDWLLAPYARIDTMQATLGQYTETAGAASNASALTYFRQTIRSNAASLGLRSELRYHLAAGQLLPQFQLAYQRNFQGTGRAGITYADLAAAGPAYYVADASQDNSQWMGTVGARLVLKNSLSLHLYYSHTLANSLISSQSVNFIVQGRF